MDGALLDRLLGDLPVALLVLREEDLRLEYASPLVRQVVGCERLLLGMPLAEALPELVQQGALAVIHKAGRTGRPLHIDAAPLAIRKEGRVERLVFTWNVHPLRDGRGRADGVIALGVDVTQLAREHRRAERTVAELDALLAQCPDGIGLWDRDLRFLRVNPALAGMNHRPADEHRGRTMEELAPEVGREVRLALLEALHGGGSVRRTISGRWGAERPEQRWVQLTAYPVHHAHGPPSVGGILEDATDRVRREHERLALLEEQRLTAERLAASEREFRALVESIPQLVWRAGPDGHPQWVNRQWREFTGIDVEDVAARGWDALVHHDDLAAVAERWQRSIATGEAYEMELRLRRHDGRYCWFLVRSLPYAGGRDDVAGWFGTCTDVDDRHRAEEQRERLVAAERAARAQAEENERRARLLGASIRASEERLRLAVEAAEVGTWDLDPSTGALTWDDRSKVLFGVPPSAEVGVEMFLSALHPQDRERVRGVLEGEHTDVFDEEFRVLGLVDGVERRLRVRARMHFREGAPRRLIGTVRDVTADVEAREAVQRHARVRELFLGVLGHDLRNPLAAVRMSVQLLLNRSDLPEEAVHLVRRIGGSAARMSTMIRQLLDTTRVRLGGGLALELRQADLGAMCRQVVDEIRTATPEADIHVACGEELQGTWDPDRLEQVLANLLSNAVTHGEGPVDVTASADDGLVHVRVHNGGPTIAPELLPTLFDPFKGGHQHRSSTSGLGLGLFISQHIARAHGGEVRVRSAAGEGTTFTLVLPRHTRATTHEA